MTNKITIIGIVAIATMAASCQAIKNCCSKDKCKTEKTEGTCNKCGNNSCTPSCSSKISSDTL